MDCYLGGETPVTLQLHKWAPSQFELNLSEFREAFISPTRELLLLLSYQCEALLLPLVTGDPIDCISEICHNEASTTFCSRSSTEPSCSNSPDHISSTHASAANIDSGFSINDKFSKSCNYPYVCDVNSLAWGISGDTYDLHEDVLFREFLFVCNGHCVTVHAFRNLDKTATVDECRQGKWVDWGPSTSVQTMGSQDSCGSYSDGTNSIMGVKKTNRESESLQDVCKESGITSKRWLHSFFTKAETVKSDGNIWTRFPEKSSFPCSAKVVSFSILDKNLLLHDFLSHGNSASSIEENPLDTVLDPDGSMTMSDSFGASSYKCSRVFSSNSHCLVGFVLSLTDSDSLSVHATNEIERSKIKVLLLVARLDSSGIQWVSKLKLADSINADPVAEWTDFSFSNDLLVCLKASGLISFYAAMSGECVGHLDVLQACGLNPHSSGWLQQKLSAVVDSQIKSVDEIHEKSASQCHNLFGRGIFRKLLVASHTSLLAVVDAYSIVYVVCTGDYLPHNYHAHDKLLPHFQHFGLGVLSGWEVGGSEIGHQKGYSNKSLINNEDTSYVNHNKIKSSMQHENIHVLGLQGDFCSSVFSAASEYRSCDPRVHLQPMRKVFLPPEGFSEDDCICFSPLGVTRLTRKHNINAQRTVNLTHSNLRMGLVVHDDRYFDYGGKVIHHEGKEEASIREAIGCSFQGCLYLVRKVGLSVVLPSLSSSSSLPVETLGYRHHSCNTDTVSPAIRTLQMSESKELFPAWKLEVLDRVLIYEGPEEADRLCFGNGWDIKMSRIRRLQMALDYLKFDEIEQSLEMLVSVNLAEEGILRLLFAAVYFMCQQNGNDSEASAASRLLALATCFTTKMIRNFGLLQQKNGAVQYFRNTHLLSLPPVLPEKLQHEMWGSRRLHEMAHLLEIIRNLQYRLRAKVKKPGQGLVDAGESLNFMGTDLSEDECQTAIVPANDESIETLNQKLPIFAPMGSKDEKLVLMSKDALDYVSHADQDDLTAVSEFVQAGNLGRKVFPLENPQEMIARWKLDNMDLKTVVKDALLSGRLPLAVLQLHLHRSRDLNTDEEPTDTFKEVHDVGRAIAYDLFLKGETAHAIVTLQRLGEDIETCLKELLFGTVRRSLRIQVAEEVRRYGYLGPYDWKMLEKVSLIERLYPSSSFWKTFLVRQKTLMRAMATSSLPSEITLRLLHPHPFGNFIECGEIDGIVLGSWTSMNGNSPDPVVDEDTAHTGYWSAAAVWSSVWDQRTIDRIVMDQPFHMGVHVLWESQLDYYLCHNDLEEVFKLMDLIPTSVLSFGSLQITLDDTKHSSSVGPSSELPEYSNYICPVDEVDAVCMDVPGVKILRFSIDATCSMWLKMLMEQELAKKFIFLKDYWEGTAEIVAVLARSGFITCEVNRMSSEDYSIKSFSDLSASTDGEFHSDPRQALHKLIVRYCVQYDLPNFLDLYLDHHKLARDNDSLFLLQEAAGDCQWAKWLLLSRIKGHEYEASFCNARSIMSHDSNLSVLEIDEIIRTVDDIAEGGGEMAALATLMYAPIPIQNCLSSGSVLRHSSSTSQCTLENLRPTLQRFPTLWRTLVTASIGEESSNLLGSKTNNALSNYLCWRDNIFFSSARDTSLLQMLPCWFPKTVRRLIQLYIQGPLGWQSFSGLPVGDSLLDREVDFYIHADEHTEISAVSWEATIQKHVQEELYVSSIGQTGHGLEHLLHRGRALAAFNHILGVRVQKLKLEGKSGVASHGQTNIQLDVQKLLAPLTRGEEAILSSVFPLAITQFEDSVLVASCAFLLELCGLSASMLRVDIASLKRISSFYKLNENDEKYGQFSFKHSTFHVVSGEAGVVDSLARTLADEYLLKDCGSDAKPKKAAGLISSKQPSRALMLVLQHLEKASLPLMIDGKTCGSWLLTGNGDGAELRSYQKATGQRWNLVKVFCQIHQLPLSTKYLAVLARDNDWVGYLSEAQSGGYPFDTVIQVATKEFSDPRLKIHILTVLKGMQSRKKAGSPPYSDIAEVTSCSDDNVLVPAELFRILADCEKQKNPGEALLRKAKEMSWSLLAMVASCFPDVSPLSCLTVWLEITAARETSAIKVNNIASRIADNVGAAVEATNSLPVGNRAVTFHYNRQNAKRRRLMEPISVDPLVSTADVSSTSEVSVAKVTGEEERKDGENVDMSSDSDEGPVSLSKMVAVLCEQHLFLPLLKAFEMFLPSCSLLPFIRALQAFSQMRLSEASAHLGSFSARIQDEASSFDSGIGRGQTGTSWLSSTAIKAANSMLSICPSPYEKRSLLKLLAATDFGDGGSAAAHYRRLYWKINLAEPLLRKDDNLHLGNETLDDTSLLTALENNGHWEQARNWARQLEASGGPWKSAVHHVTETQAESMVNEWKEFLWDVPEERVALWGHCQTLFLRYCFPPLQAGLFFLKHAEAVEKDLPPKELHELLLLSLQWLSGMTTQSNLVYPINLLREIETRVWLLAVESEAQVKSDGDFTITTSSRDPANGNASNIIDKTANFITQMDMHINLMTNRMIERHDARENMLGPQKNQALDASTSTAGFNVKTKKRAKAYLPSRRPPMESTDKNADPEDVLTGHTSKNEFQLQDENFKLEISFSKWEERVGPAELETAVLSLLEFGQIAAAKQLQHKLSPENMPSEFALVNAALKLAAKSTPSSKVSPSELDDEVYTVVQSYNIFADQHLVDPLEVLESLTTIFTEGSGRGLCKRIVAVVKAANVLGLSFSEAFDKQPVELLQLLSLKAQESFEEASMLVQTHSMPTASIAQILAESFLKGLLAAHRGGYMDSQKEEGPAPLLWRFSDFLKWAELCPSQPEIGHALMRLVITGQEIPHACEVELLILSHHFYKSSACLDGVDVLVALAATRVEAYVAEGDFPCLARLITGVGNFHALNFILGILIENGQLDLLLQKYSAAADTAEAVRAFRMAVLTSLKHFNPKDLDAFAMVYNHFDMKHETAALLESRALQSCEQWFHRYDKDQNEDLLESMRYFIEAATVHSSIDAGNKTCRTCAQASLVSLQIRMPDSKWLNLSETNARRLLVEQSRFQEALIVAEAYGLNQPSEWALVLWNQMLKPELTQEFVAEFVAVLPLQPSMLVELARFYRAEVAARGDQSQFSVWLTGGGLPEWAKYLGRSFRCLLRRTRDMRLRLQLATVATGFGDIINACMKALDKVPDTAGPLVLRRGHGGAYLPLM